MLNWLAVWLQQIIAVVLLAGFIDLLLPNKGMQRYVRLVAGLIILLTILTPIIRVLQGDFSAKLDAQVQNWMDAGSTKNFRMPTLQDIQEGAKVLKQKEAASASALAERQLAAAMKAGVEQATGLHVAAVNVRMAAGGNGEAQQIGGVSVTLAAREPEQQPLAGNAPGGDGTARTSSGAGDEQAVTPVEEVDAVHVTVQQQTEQASQSATEWQAKPAAEVVAAAVKSVLRAGWSVNPALVAVLEQVPQTAAAQ